MLAAGDDGALRNWMKPAEADNLNGAGAKANAPEQMVFSWVAALTNTCGGGLVAPLLQQDVKLGAVLVDRTPQRVHVVPGGNHDLANVYARQVAPIVDAHLLRT